MKAKSLLIILFAILLPGSHSVFVSNADEPKQLAFCENPVYFGKGIIKTALWRDDGEVLAIASTVGVSVYQRNMELIAFVRLTSVATMAWDNQNNLIIADNRGQIFTWDLVEILSTVNLTNFDNEVELSVLSPHGHLLGAINDEGILEIWDTASGEKLYSLSTSLAQTLAWNHDESLVATAGREKIEVWDIATGNLLNTLQRQSRELVWSRKSNTLLSEDFNKLWFWDVERGRSISSITLDEGQYVLGLSPDGSQMASSEPFGYEISLWDLETRTITATITVEDNVIEGILWEDDLVTFYGLGLKTWNRETGQLMSESVDYSTGTITSIAWRPDGRVFASSDHNGVGHLWDAGTRDVISSFEVGGGGSFGVVKWSSDGQLFLTSNQSPAISIWQVVDGLPTENLRYTFSGSAAAWNSEQHLLAFASNDQPGTIEIWNLDTTTRVGTVSIADYWVHLEWSYDGQMLAIEDSQGAIAIWNKEENQPARRILPELSTIFFAWSPTSQLLAGTQGDSNLYLWDADQDEIIKTLQSPSEPLLWIAWQPEGRYVAAIAGGYTIEIWDTTSGERFTLQDDKTEIVPFTVLEWSPSGDSIAVGDAHGVIRVWEQCQ